MYFVVLSIGFDPADECLTAYAPSLTAPWGIQTLVHTRYVGAPLHAAGRIPIRGFKGLAPHRCQAAPDPRGFLTAMDRGLSLSVGPSIKPRGSDAPASKLGLPTAVGHWLSKGRRRSAD